MKLTIIVSLLICWIALPLRSTLRSDEPCEQFLQALRDQGYHDVALEYLKEMESSPLASPSFQATVPFETAQTLISSTERIRDFKLLEQRLSEAEQLLAQSESNAKSPELIAKSQQVLGDLLFRRASNYLSLAESERLTAGEKTEYFNQARGYLQSSFDAFASAKESYEKMLKEFQLDPRSPESRDRQKLLRATYVYVSARVPLILERSADTLDSNDPKRSELLTEAATEYEKLWLNYPGFPAALDSGLFAARCQYKLQKYSIANSLLQQILSLPDVPAYAVLKRRAMSLAADCWSVIEPYPFDDVISNLEPAILKLNRRDLGNSDWQRIQLELARAYRTKAVALEAQDGDSGRIKNLNRDAAKMMKLIARLPGDQRTLARTLLEQWDLTIEALPEVESAPITTFTDAKLRGAEMMPQLEAMHSDVINFHRQLAAATDEDEERGEIQQELNEAQSQLSEFAQRTLTVLDRALRLADENVPREDINQIRYSQCVCHYMQQRYFESALIGEFLVDRHPTIPFSRQAGGLAMRSCAVLHDQADPDDKEFERGRLLQLAENVLQRWPGTSESTEAADMLTKLIFVKKEISDEEFRKAEQYISQVPDGSAEGSALNVKMGSELWLAYNRNHSVGDAQSTARLDSAIDYLSRGVGGFNSGNLNMDAALGSLFLVNALLEAKKVSEAIEQLETSPLAPIELVKQKNPVVMESKLADLFVAETWKAAVKTYLAAMKENPSAQVWMDKAIGVVTAMQAQADQSTDPIAKQTAVAACRLLASQMLSQFEAIEDPSQQKQFAENLTRFLDTIQSRSNDPNTIIWAGQTLLDLADTFASQSMNDQARPLFDLAIAALDRAAKTGIQDTALIFELKRQQAVAQRGLGNFQQSHDDLLDLIREKPNSWQAQMDIARTLQKWGVQKQETQQLAKALSGTERVRDPKTKRQQNLVWGWSRLTDVLGSDDRFREPYLQCLYAAIETRLEYGRIEGNPKVVAAAMKQLKMSKVNDASADDSTWILKFGQLEQRIQDNLK